MVVSSYILHKAKENKNRGDYAHFFGVRLSNKQIYNLREIEKRQLN